MFIEYGVEQFTEESRMLKNRIVKSFVLVAAVCSLLFNGIETAASEGGDVGRE